MSKGMPLYEWTQIPMTPEHVTTARVFLVVGVILGFFLGGAVTMLATRLTPEEPLVAPYVGVSFDGYDCTVAPENVVRTSTTTVEVKQMDCTEPHS